MTLAFSRVRPDARTRLEQLGLLMRERVFDTNRAATAVLAQTDQPTKSKE